MKKVVILFICFFFIAGCNKKENVEKVQKKDEVFIVEKIDVNEDYVYYKNYKEVNMSTGVYVYKYPVINIKSDEIENLNLELKNFIVRSYKDAGIYNGYLNSGNIVDFKYCITDGYISIVNSYYYYIDGMVGEYSDDVYVISLKTGKLVNNSDILKYLNMTEESFYELLESKLETDDIAYSIMNVKKNGYSLYLNEDNKLCVIFYEITDEEEQRKELVLN